jgi:hypothetical protein
LWYVKIKNFWSGVLSLTVFTVIDTGEAWL